jgi:hypothetical protein
MAGLRVTAARRRGRLEAICDGMQAVIPDVAAYDQLYKRLIGKITLADVSSSFVMEEIKSTTVLPLDYAPAKRS